MIKRYVAFLILVAVMSFLLYGCYAKPDYPVIILTASGNTVSCRTVDAETRVARDCIVGRLHLDEFHLGTLDSWGQ